MTCKYKIGYDIERNIMFIFKEYDKPIICDLCKKELDLINFLVIHIDDHGQDHYYCENCLEKYHPIGKIDQSFPSYITDILPKSFRYIHDFNPLISGKGNMSVWDTKHLEGYIIDNTKYSNTIPSLEGATIGVPIEDQQKDLPIKDIKQIDQILSKDRIPIRPGFKTPQQIEDDRIWKERHENAEIELEDKSKEKAKQLNNIDI